MTRWRTQHYRDFKMHVPGGGGTVHINRFGELDTGLLMLTDEERAVVDLWLSRDRFFYVEGSPEDLDSHRVRR